MIDSTCTLLLLPGQNVLLTTCPKSPLGLRAKISDFGALGLGLGWVGWVGGWLFIGPSVGLGAVET